MQTGWTQAPPPHCPEAVPPMLSDKQLREGSVSADATVASNLSPQPTTVPSVNPADVANMTARLPCPADHPIQCLPPPATSHS